MCSATALSASALAARTFNCSVNCSIRCQGTDRAAEMIKTTAAPNRIWHLAASEMRNWRIRLNILSCHCNGRGTDRNGGAVPIE